MRTIPAALAARLEGATSLCHCWSLTRRDGVLLGFTDHDRDLAFEGLSYAARTGLEAAEASAELGFAVGGGDVAGAALWSKCTKGTDDLETFASRRSYRRHKRQLEASCRPAGLS